MRPKSFTSSRFAQICSGIWNYSGIKNYNGIKNCSDNENYSGTGSCGGTGNFPPRIKSLSCSTSLQGIVTAMPERSTLSEQQNQSGISRLGVLVIVLFIASLVFAGSQIFPFFYYYYELQGLMESQAAKAQLFTDQEIRKNIMDKIKKLDIPIDREDDLKINRVGKKIVIDFSYSEVLYVNLGEDRTYDLWVFEFSPHAEAVY